VQIARKPVAGENVVGGLRRTAVGVAVADVDDFAHAHAHDGYIGALARLAAGSARVPVAKRRPPAVRMPLDLVGAQLELEPLTLEDRFDQLPEVARDDRGPVL